MKTKYFVFLLLFASGFHNFNVQKLHSQNIISYSFPKEQWKEMYGNHRAVIEVRKISDVIRLKFNWRRHDKNISNTKFIIMNASTGEEIKNIFRININNETCDLIFGPIEKTGNYYFYYLPYEVQEGWGFYSKNYLKPEEAPSEEWRAKNRLNKGEIIWKKLSVAEVLQIQSRSEFDSFYPMEVIATASETEKFLKKYTDDFLVFPEDRQYPIRMKDALPFRWINKPPENMINCKAIRNEYFTFQLGVYSNKTSLNNLEVVFENLTDQRGNQIPASFFTCFNTTGVDAYGDPFKKNIDINKGVIQPLWIGIDIPQSAVAGIYNGFVSVKTDNCKSKKIKVVLTIENEFSADRGDGETWKHSRLRWLNSRLGIDDEPVSPYSKMILEENKISATGKSVQLNSFGFPEQIKLKTNSFLSSSIKFFASTEKGIIEFTNPTFRITDQKNGKISWESIFSNNDLEFSVQGNMEFDGYLLCNVRCKIKNDISIDDLRLEIPMKKEYAQIMMGMSLSGCDIPEEHSSKWKTTEDSFWFGNGEAGIHCEFRGSTYNGPMLNLYHPKPPDSWDNSGKGGFKIKKYTDKVIASAFSGKRDLKAGGILDFKFAFILTPVKEIDYRSQFVDRYYHGGNIIPLKEDIEAGVKLINIHHANKYNPFINYPFIAKKELRNVVDEMHSKGMKVKIYYTVRELTDYVTEVWALRSLGYEVLADGNGGGYPWLREHFVDNYTTQWYNHFDDLGYADAAVLTSGESRWYNYYIEGLAWLVKNMDIDGLYLDDVTYDRRILKRMRKVMDMVKPGCVIDLHSNTGFSLGPAIQYTEYFPYVNKLWFGESFQYDKMTPSAWLVETSGIPFGLMGDMLQGGGNRWRGMIYGMTNRHPWVTDGILCDPRPIWKIWDTFGIQDSRMIGYWDKESPISTSSQKVLSTVYIKKDKALISIASWEEYTVSVKLNFNWEKLGFDPSNVKIEVPFIKDFQSSKIINIQDSIMVEPKKGWIFVVSKK